jgi:hypothetical protein
VMQTRNSDKKNVRRQKEAWKICCCDLWSGPMHTDVDPGIKKINIFRGDFNSHLRKRGIFSGLCIS